MKSTRQPQLTRALAGMEISWRLATVALTLVPRWEERSVTLTRIIHWEEASEACDLAHRVLRRIILRDTSGIDERFKLLAAYVALGTRGAFAYVQLHRAKETLTLATEGRSRAFQLSWHRGVATRAPEVRGRQCRAELFRRRGQVGQFDHRAQINLHAAIQSDSNQPPRFLDPRSTTSKDPTRASKRQVPATTFQQRGDCG